MRRIAAGKITRAAAAKRLGVGARQVNRLMVAHGVSRPPSEAAEAREWTRVAAEEHRQMKVNNAHRAIAGNQSVEEAAINAGCSVRTMFRWVKKLSKPSKSRSKSKKKA